MTQYTITLEIMDKLLFFYSFTLSSNTNDTNNNYQPEEPPDLVYVCLMSVILQIKKIPLFLMMEDSLRTSTCSRLLFSNPR